MISNVRRPLVCHKRGADNQENRLRFNLDRTNTHIQRAKHINNLEWARWRWNKGILNNYEIHLRHVLFKTFGEHLTPREKSLVPSFLRKSTETDKWMSVIYVHAGRFVPPIEFTYHVAFEGTDRRYLFALLMCPAVPAARHHRSGTNPERYFERI